MILTDFSIKRPISILMVVCIILLLGFVSLTRLPIDLLPNMELPFAAVITSYGGAGPREVENLVTRPMEEILGTVQNLKNVYSFSYEGSSMIGLEFEYGTDMDFALLQIREKVDMIKKFLPQEADNPMVIKADPSMMPVLMLSMTGGKDMTHLQSIAEDIVKPRMERLDGVASVYIGGGMTREVKVEVDMSKLMGYGLSLDRIVSALRLENTDMPGGTLDDGRKEFLVRTIGEFQSIEEIKNIPIALPSGATVKLADVADVKDSFKDKDSLSRMNGKPSISISVQKQTSANTVQVARRVAAELERLKTQLPENVTIKYAFNQADFINRAIGRVAQNAAAGSILAVMVLYLFLRNLRTTLIIGISIPISIISTFILIYFNGLTINMLSLGGLALGVGMLVDNAIVVLENIFRFGQEGYSRFDAASKGSAEVASAVAASTLTTIAVFLPVVFVQGLTSQLFREMALTVTFSLLASLAVSLTLVPMLSSRLLKVVSENTGGTGNGVLKKLFDRTAAALEGLNSVYGKALRWSLSHRKWIVVLAAAAFILSIVMLPFVKMEFIPSADQGQFTIDIKMPNGTKLEDTDRLAVRVEQVLNEIPEVDAYFASVGGNNAFGMQGGSGGGDVASITVTLVKKAKRDRSVWDVIEEVRKKTRDIAGGDIKVSEPQMIGGGMGGSSAPVVVEIKGDDFGILGRIADDLAGYIKNLEGTRDVKTSLEEGRPEVQLRIDRERAAGLGLSAGQIASAVSNAIQGQVATRYKVEGDEIDVRVIPQEEFRSNIQFLKDLMISTPLGVSVPLEDLVKFTRETGPVTIERMNQVRVVRVESYLAGRDIGSISREIRRYIDGMKLPVGYTVEMGGQQREMMEAFSSLFLALLLAIALVYMVMAVQFESLLHPFTIMFSVPLALFGVVFSLLVTRRALSVPSFIGIIMLAGIVVNNAIVLVTYINTLRQRGLERNEAILKAGPTRLRPILMTTLTTLLGLVPLALGIGEGAEMQAPLATVVIGGLAFSTVLTLVVVPVVYTLFDDLGSWIIKRRLRRRRAEANAGA